jgi:L-alanine-DL-glutamate epimerase-like enolase superfamily enzyme
VSGKPDAIAAVEVYSYDLSYRHGEYVMSKGRVVSTLESTIVRLVTEEGVSGFGEVCPLGTAYLPGFPEGVRAAIAAMGPQLLGADVTSPAALHRAMDAALAGHAYAKAGVDIACFDALGRRSGLPVAALLGGRVTDAFALYIAVPLADPAAMAAHVTRSLATGIHRFQLKVGGAVSDDCERVAAVLDATSAGDLVIADANGGWGQLEAVRAARLLAGLAGSDRLLLEQPCATLEECAAVRAKCSLPMILDEPITDLQALLRADRLRLGDAVNLKIGRVGGLGPARRLRDTAVSLGWSLTIEDSWGGDVTTAAVSHLAASTPSESLLNVSFMNDWTAPHIADYQPRSADGHGSAPAGPGLGIDVNLAALGPPRWQCSAATG